MLYLMQFKTLYIWLARKLIFIRKFFQIYIIFFRCYCPGDKIWDPQQEKCVFPSECVKRGSDQYGSSSFGGGGGEIGFGGGAGAGGASGSVSIHGGTTFF